MLRRLAAASLGLVALAASPDLAAARRRVAAFAVLPLRAPALVIRKADRVLELWEGSRRLKTYPVALGHRGLADKRREGDHLTPEGRFRVCSRNAQSRFHLFLGLDYPGEAAARRGLEEGHISKSQHDAILQSHRAGACPPWNTSLGGAVGIHGGGIGSDWTWGCIALEDADIEDLWIACPVGTPVEIRP